MAELPHLALKGARGVGAELVDLAIRLVGRALVDVFAAAAALRDCVCEGARANAGNACV